MSGLPLVSGLQGRALQALATYRFLTIELMRLADVGRDPKSLRAALRAMAGKGWIGHTERTSEPGLGALPILYYLKPSGAALLVDLHGPPAPSPVRHAPQLKEALPHRLSILRTHILLRQWAASAGATVTAFRADYDAGPSRGQKATEIPYQEGGRTKPYTPDAIATVQLADGQPRLLVIEVYWGGRGRKLDHFKAKLPELHTVAEQEAVEAHEGNPARARFLVLFKDDAMRKAALRWWPDQADEVWEDFHVKALPELDRNFVGGWWGPGRESGPLFGVSGQIAD